jgi:hypothetical protein
MTRISLVKEAHNLIKDRLHPGDVAIDATVGNGHDTLLLVEQVMPTGRVYGFDIQQAALDSTRPRCEPLSHPECLTLIHASHALMTEKIPGRHHGKINAIMFNLGYLPGGDKSIITRTDSTLQALNGASRLLAIEGLITILAYPGHAGGNQETDQVRDWCGQLDTKLFKVNTVYSTEHKNSAPRLFTVRKIG